MIHRRDSLAATLDEIEGGTLDGVAVIVVSRGWWDELSLGERGDYRRRCEGRGVQLRADERLSRHFVELGADEGEPPLSSERVI